MGLVCVACGAGWLRGHVCAAMLGLYCTPPLPQPKRPPRRKEVAK